MIEFKAWPKTPRLFRDVIITEKIDGTNAAIQILKVVPPTETPENGQIWIDNVDESLVTQVAFIENAMYLIVAQSRKRIITPAEDNHGFATWVQARARELVEVLGVGVHYGEWWGSGIQRGYGLPKGEKRFSLFNVNRYDELVRDENDIPVIEGLDTVPTIYRGAFSEEAVRRAIAYLRQHGSDAAGSVDFAKPEGIAIYHTASGQVFKVLLENDEIPKGLAA